ncbi:hypothetical protein HOD20_01605 [archaeon]|jgi:hypothetical protein|nr:hypothetical protein [archaeon]MBT4351200.1 hypothetical protein [archaeon]MBT4646782.1 hypothetical protein [archaeon]MBT6821458.1 hypothetical protein [archaeon]MBT7392940.1 hypothetical protein [archaeon]
MVEKTIIGASEKIKIFHGEDKIKELVGKIDTGATKSSIDINLASELKLGPITNTKVVKSASGVALRPIIMVTVEIQGRKITEEFTLANRGNLKYPILIGLNILKKNFMVDPQINCEQ